MIIRIGTTCHMASAHHASSDEIVAGLSVDPKQAGGAPAESLPPGGGFDFQHQYSPPVPEFAAAAAAPTAKDAPAKTRGSCKQLIGATKQEALVDGTIKDCEPRRPRGDSLA